MTRHPLCGCPLAVFAPTRAERRAARRFGRRNVEAITVHRRDCILGVKANGATRSGVHNASTKTTGRK